MMRVAFDTNALYVSQAGTARYVRGLQTALAKLQCPDLEVCEFAWKVANFDYKQPTRAIKTFYRELIWGSFIAPARLKQAKVDILHSTLGPFVQPPTGIRLVVTLHDLAILRYPRRFRRWHRIGAQARLKKLQSADQIICVSQFTADEGMALLGLPARKLHVIHHGVDDFDEVANLSASDIRFPDEFFLFVGSLEPGKNLRLLRETYLLAEQANRNLPPLVIIGARWVGVPGEGPPPKSWMYLGRQPDDVLRIAYKRAKALLFPSIYEGFGFPIVEAQMAGCPVICSSIASLPEVVGSGALFADLSAQAYLDAIWRLERESDLRDNLIREGKANAQRFTWARCAEATARVYRSALT